MDFNEYKYKAMEYRLETAKDPMYAFLNLSGEVGELHSLIAKSIRDGRKPDHIDNVVKELGDILWMVAAIADDHALNLNFILQANLDKLNSRKQRNVITGSGDNR